MIISKSCEAAFHLGFSFHTHGTGCVCTYVGGVDPAGGKGGIIDKFSTGRRRLKENIAQKTGKEAVDNSEFEERSQRVADLKEKVGREGGREGWTGVCCPRFVFVLGLFKDVDAYMLGAGSRLVLFFFFVAVLRWTGEVVRDRNLGVKVRARRYG